MLISVIVPVYNMEKCLERCMRSLLDQTYTNLEIILINDGSSDSSGEMCDRYAEKDQRIKVIHQKNGGASAARNSGLNAAQGEYVSMVDPDDWMELTAYAVLVNAIASASTTPDVVRFNAYQNNRVINPIPFVGLYTDDQLKTEFVASFVGPENFGGLFIMGVPWLQIYRRELVEKYNVRYILHNRLEDRLFNASVYLRCESVLFLDDVLYHYTVNQGSLTNRYNSDQWQKEVDYIELLDKECLSLGLYSQDLKNRFYNDVLLRAIMTIHYEFFSGINNSFKVKYNNVKQIVNSTYVEEASKMKLKGEISTKNRLILFFIKHKCAFLTSVFEEFIVFINKIK